MVYKIKYFLYARKSSESEDRQIASIDSQLEVLKNLAKEKGLEIVDVFKESKSAKEPGRPCFNKMVERIKSGEAQGIICWKIDRLFRNPVDFGTISWMLQRSIIKHIQCSDRSYYPEDNVLLMSVEQGMANQFIRDLSKNTKRGLQSKADRGWYPAQPPLGYLHNPLKKKGEKEIMIDPATFDLTRKMFDLMLTGIYLPSQLVNKINNELGLRNRFGRKIGRTTIYHILSNPFYYGYYEYPGKSGNWIKGNHQPMITREEFEQIKKILNRKNNPKPEKKIFAYTGIIRCGECGAMITAEEKHKHQKNGNKHDYIYYHCTKRTKKDCSQKTILLDQLENQINQILRKIYIPEEFIEWAISSLKSDLLKDIGDRKMLIEGHKKQREQLMKKRDKLTELKLKSLIEDEEYLKKKDEIRNTEVELTSLIAKLENESDAGMEDIEALLKFGSSAAEVFSEATLEQKRLILSCLGSNLSLKDKILNIELEKPLLLLNEINVSLKGRKVKKNRLEPAEVSIKKGTYNTFNTVNPLMLPKLYPQSLFIISCQMTGLCYN